MLRASGHSNACFFVGCMCFLGVTFCINYREDFITVKHIDMHRNCVTHTDIRSQGIMLA